MLIISCQLTNFASYADLSFDFTDKGLCLIHGATGSGKSTLCDAIPWVLFGGTSKGGAVDEILSWPGDKLTTGRITLSSGVTIERHRGAKSGDNDLFIIKDEKFTRGKDLKDTQKLINNLLGFDYETYLAGAYYHEFSQTASFFTTTSKIRRTITEQLADLSLAKNLALKLSDARKTLKADLNTATSQLSTLTAKQEQLEDLLLMEVSRADSWEADKAEKTEKLEQRYQKLAPTLGSFREEQELLEHLQDKLSATSDEKCGHCGSKLESNTKEILVQKINELKSEIYVRRSYHQVADSILSELEELATTKNTHHDAVADLTNKLSAEMAKIAKLANLETSLKTQLNDVETLVDIVASYRGLRISNTVNSIQDNTNRLLRDHFDGEISVEFTIDTDELEISITKDSNKCSYTQLSKGQRQLLKLCFGLSVMRQVQNQHGVTFGSIFLDEVLSGLDENFKIKALRLLEQISTEYNSVFVVEHSSEFKAMINSRIKVELVDGHSEITHE